MPAVCILKRRLHGSGRSGGLGRALSVSPRSPVSVPFCDVRSTKKPLAPWQAALCCCGQSLVGRWYDGTAGKRCTCPRSARFTVCCGERRSRRKNGAVPAAPAGEADGVGRAGPWQPVVPGFSLFRHAGPLEQQRTGRTGHRRRVPVRLSAPEPRASHQHFPAAALRRSSRSISGAACA